MDLPHDKEEFVKKLHEGIDDTSRKIDELRVQANLAQAESKQYIEERIEQLEQKRRDLKSEADHLYKSTDSAFHTLRDGCAASWKAFRESVDKALSEFKS